MKKEKTVISLIIFLTVFIWGCTSSEYICVKIHKSAFAPDSVEINREKLIEGGIRICTAGQRYYYKNYAKGGGNNSFTGFCIPVHLDSTAYGTYSMKVEPRIIKVTGIGYQTGDDGRNPMRVELFALPNETIFTNISN